ncbi:hypothetical protein TREMEDRAFT_74387 [Tremella mesenterica DSM 1558]|uniref:uncharacterized protein n=1 Tax=Tremella mesenterica (strain ATCC 24925 / CBS 8224 / DSM 1558 / NBRC 9311 / NRRL Y-6157 / RJB 2259-6 / UBC 559-6) TaxID=578456 RepID=UPI0003F4907E|nr:uncharacterized protein TREMEDRAFT_74387 [Tremella mesenterica DSM 1558]EIW68032.1 hypothetical protein TREMEDRAFT_74387 [Tremella mesenterica DSM 1558]
MSEDSKVQWDAFYNDPKDDIVFVSNDKIHFRASSWLMKRHSQFIKDMLDFPGKGNISDAHIDLEAPAHIVRHFIALCYTTGPFHMELKETKVSQIIVICEKLQCSQLIQRVLGDLVRFVDYDPVESFIFAAEYRHVELAKAAIALFPEDPKVPFSPVLGMRGKSDGLASRYLIEIMRLRYQCRYGYNSPELRTWKEVSSSFNP